jgi:exopolysaccharide biosynthesis WecB/TagA/CpsF family protein
MSASTTPDRIVLGGAVVDLCERAQVIDALTDRISGAAGRRPLAVASANLDHIHHFGAGGAARDRFVPEGRALEWLVLLDGVPLVRRAEALTNHRWPLLAGSDLLPVILALAEENAASVGFLGGTPQTHENLRAPLAQQYPALKVAGMWSPFRAQLDDPTLSAGIADTVATAGTDLLVVSLGKPRQEAWIQRHAAATGARVLLAFGASTDFLAGTATRAPSWVRRAGVEWAYRLAREPRRLLRRYALQGPPALRRLRNDSHVPPTRAPMKDGEL